MFLKIRSKIGRRYILLNIGILEKSRLLTPVGGYAYRDHSKARYIFMRIYTKSNRFYYKLA